MTGTALQDFYFKGLRRAPMAAATVLKPKRHRCVMPCQGAVWCAPPQSRAGQRFAADPDAICRLCRKTRFPRAGTNIERRRQAALTQTTYRQRLARPGGVAPVAPRRFRCAGSCGRRQYTRSRNNLRPRFLQEFCRCGYRSRRRCGGFRRPAAHGGGGRGRRNRRCARTSAAARQ